jgi:hypothetical protein
MAKPTEDTGWQKPLIVTDNGNPRAELVLPTGVEKKPCMTCKSWEKDEQKLIQFLLANGLQANEAGRYIVAVIAKEFPDRKQYEIDVKSFGYCRRECMPAHMNATCEKWQEIVTREDLKGRIR